MADTLDILIADEDPFAAGLLNEICLSIAGIQVLGVARSKAMLIAKINHCDPDLILVDLTAGMGGIQTVDTLRNMNSDLDIIVTYHPDDHDSNILVAALEKGVYECMEKSMEINSRQYNEFRLHLLTITGLLNSRKRFSSKPASAYKNKFFMPLTTLEKPIRPLPLMGKIDIVVMASSTGGPEILSRIFSLLPASLKIPILLVQHIPAAMTQYFAKSMDEKSELDIFQASHGDVVTPAKVYVAPGGQHMTVSRPDEGGRRRILLNSRPPVNSVRPSADVLFKSIARSYQGNVLAIVLTGMGEDGKKGVAAMKENSCICVSQKAETCVVYGMPRAVDEAGLSDESLDPLSITQKIVMAAQ